MPDVEQLGRWIESMFCLKTTNPGVGLKAVVGGRPGKSRKGHGLELTLGPGVDKESVLLSERGLRLVGGG